MTVVPPISFFFFFKYNYYVAVAFEEISGEHGSPGNVHAFVPESAERREARFFFHDARRLM